MKNNPTDTTITVDATDPSCAEGALSEALSHLLAPLARLSLAKGISFATVEELLKRAFVQEAAALQQVTSGHGAVSRISTATGINRREVTRLTKPAMAVREAKNPPASEVFARWTADPALRDTGEEPLVLKRQGPAPSFEALAQSVTRDVHPRSLLEELVRLGLACHDAESDSVTLCRTEFVPGNDSRQMLGFLGDNVGDHLNAAVANVLGEQSHFEQAVFADGLSVESIETLRPLITSHWQALRDAMVPALTALIEADRLAGRCQDQRARIGLYSFSEPSTEGEVPGDEIIKNPIGKPRKGVPK